MLNKFLSCLLIFFAMIVIIHISEAEAATFAERTAGMIGIKDIRYSTGAGRLRIVLDTTKKFTLRDYTVEYYENPSRIVIDINNAWVSDQIRKDEIQIKSTAVSKIKIAQFNPTRVRLVIETMAENNFFALDGGPAGYRFVVDIGADAEKPGFDQKLKDNSKSVTEKDESVKTEKPNTDEINKVPDGIPSLNTDNKQKETENKDAKKDNTNKDDKKDIKDKDDKKDNRDKDDKKDVKDKDDKKDNRDKDDKKDKRDIDNKDINKKIDAMTKLEGKKIVIDPGHGGNDSGAIGPSGVMEKTVTLRVGLELRKLLEAEGAEVIMTREKDTEVAARGKHATDVEELKSRCDVANEAKADIFISIHADSFSKPTARGTTGYYFGKGSEESKRLADCIRKALIEQIKTPSRGTQPCNFYVVRNTNMPATLIELAFISNPIEESLLNSDDGVMKAAQGIFDGIEDYFG